MLFRAFASALLFLSLSACQSVREKNLELLKDRVDKLRPLSTWKPTWCQLESRLTEPAIARYQTSFPEEAKKLALSQLAGTWKARESLCEVTSLEDSSLLIKNHKGVMDAALCTLLQVHYVNSPFDELQVLPDDVVREEGLVHIRIAGQPGLGLYLDPAQVKVVTRTKSRGVFTASYGQIENEWLPVSVSQKAPTAQISVDRIEYDELRVGGRKMLKSFWLSVSGSDAETPLAYAQVFLKDCQNF